MYCQVSFIMGGCDGSPKVTILHLGSWKVELEYQFIFFFLDIRLISYMYVVIQMRNNIHD
jgi:hypothetical protein